MTELLRPVAHAQWMNGKWDFTVSLSYNHRLFIQAYIAGISTGECEAN